MGALFAIALFAAPVQIALADQQKPPDDFDLLPPEKAPDPQEQKALEQKLALRRKMLQLHQLGGFITLGTVSATVIVGQLDYADKYGGGGDTGKWHVLHRWMGFGTLAILGPIIASKEGQISQRDWALAHQIVGYTTLAATATGAVVLTF